MCFRQVNKFEGHSKSKEDSINIFHRLIVMRTEHNDFAQRLRCFIPKFITLVFGSSKVRFRPAQAQSFTHQCRLEIREAGCRLSIVCPHFLQTE